MSNATSNSIDTLSALKTFFGYDSFRPGQETFIRHILAGADVMAVMPTSAGKSLLYQLPALMRPGYTLVLSPLISLMADQVASLTRRQLPGAFINSTLSEGQKAKVLEDVEEGKIKLLYAAPETLCGSAFGTFLDRCRPTMIAVDEAHCLSQWGHDFRPAYLKIGSIVKKFQGIQICAFTATATPRVREDIRTHLLRPAMKVCMTTFRRPNLSFSAVEYFSRAGKEERVREILATEMPTIIYTATRRDAEYVASRFGGLYYHGDVNELERARVQQLFISGKCDLLAATNAFGLGIDRPDIRRVIHWSVPGSMEAYYQEAGRAGRDGQPAECILFHSAQDFHFQAQMIAWNNPDKRCLQDVLAYLLHLTRLEGRDTLKMTVAALKVRMPTIGNESQLNIALNMLGKFGYIERRNSSQNPGVLCFLKDPDTARFLHSQHKGQNSRLICACVERFGDKLLDGVDCTYDQLAKISGLGIQQVKHAILKSNGNEFVWTPPFYGCTTKILRTDDMELKGIDFNPLDLKRQSAQNRLNDIYNYALTRRCRQLFIMDYFGEPSNAKCGICDRCH